jgi:SagB-type dehydrogenase family enzyme
MPPSLFLSFREGVAFEEGGDGELVLRGAGAPVTLRHLSPGSRAALLRLGTSGETEDRLADRVLRDGDATALTTFYYHLERLSRAGLLLRTVNPDGVKLATLVPIAPPFDYASRALIPERRYVLSRFAYVRREQDDLALESPLARGRVVLHDKGAAALVHALARPRRADDLAGRLPDLSPAAARELLTLLLNADVLSELTTAGKPAEDEHPALPCWEFHDLLFHARSREGRHDAPVGATYRLAGRSPPPRALNPAAAAEFVELDRPDLERLSREDRPYAQVQEARRSIRAYDAEPITAGQLGEFLYRVARVKEYWEEEADTPHGPVPMVFAARPYPGGGALYELEVYAAVNACRGLAPGLYRYEPLHHRLERLSERSADVDQLLWDAARAAGVERERLQVLLIVAARFPRVAWKYASMAYALTLKNVGVLYQTMYLAATAMGLAPCALGCGNADRFARAAGTDYYAETSVGEFLLGRKSRRLDSP